MSILVAIVVFVFVVGAIAAVAAVQQVRRIKLTEIDPYAVREPWRGYVQRAVAARKQFDLIVDGASAGPLRQRLSEVGANVAAGEAEAFRLAKLGDGGVDVGTRVEGLVAQLEQASAKAASLTIDQPGTDAVQELEAIRQGIEDVTGDTGAPGLPPPP